MSHQKPENPDDGPADVSNTGVVIVGTDGHVVSEPADRDDGHVVSEPADRDDGHGLTDLVEQPAKVMRIGGMIRQLLEEVKSAPLDEPGRTRLAGVIHTSIDELKDGLAPELDEELTRLVKPFDSGTPSESELRIAQAQLVGWLEGLFHGIQTAIYAQQMSARAQLEQMQRALPRGSTPSGMPGPGQDEHPTGPSGMYL